MDAIACAGVWKCMTRVYALCCSQRFTVLKRGRGPYKHDGENERHARAGGRRHYI